MRKLKFIFCVSMVTIVVLSSATMGVLGINNKLWFQKDEVTDVYVFPTTPRGTPEKWKEFNTLEEMINACQIPEDVLKEMSTKGLIETCLNYPLYLNIFAFNSYIYGLNVLNDQFNGSRELLSRIDATKELMDYYKSIDYGKIIKSNDSGYTLRIRFFDYYMSQDKVISKLTVDERMELLEVCKKHILTVNEKYSDVFSIDSKLYLSARIMQTDDEAFRSLILDNNDLKYDMEQGRVSTELAEIVLSKLYPN